MLHTTMRHVTHVDASCHIRKRPFSFSRSLSRALSIAISLTLSLAPPPNPPPITLLSFYYPHRGTTVAYLLRCEKNVLQFINVLQFVNVLQCVNVHIRPPPKAILGMTARLWHVARTRCTDTLHGHGTTRSSCFLIDNFLISTCGPPQTKTLQKKRDTVTHCTDMKRLVVRASQMTEF